MIHSGLARGFWAGLCGAVLIALAACGDGTQTKQASASGTTNEIVLNRGNGAEPKSLDPALIDGIWEAQISGDMILGLTTEDAESKPIAGAAESWETSEDGLTWTFHLRDHTWSDGVPVTAEDFVFAWRRILDAKTAAPYAYYLYPIKNARDVNTGKQPATALGVEARDAKTLVVTLAHPLPFMTEFLTHQSMYPVPRHVVEAKGSGWARPGNFVSNGPYRAADLDAERSRHAGEEPTLLRCGEREDRRGQLLPDARWRCGVAPAARGRTGHAGPDSAARKSTFCAPTWPTR